MTIRKPLSAEELLSFFPAREPTKLQLAKTIVGLADENARLREDRRRERAYILNERDGSGKSTLEWINNSRLAAAHFALTEAGHSYDQAADLLIKSQPQIQTLLKENRRAIAFTVKERLIQLRKNFQSGRATKNKGGIFAFQYSCEVIRINKSDPDKLVQLAAALILAIDWEPSAPA